MCVDGDFPFNPLVRAKGAKAAFAAAGLARGHAAKLAVVQVA